MVVIGYCWVSLGNLGGGWGFSSASGGCSDKGGTQLVQSIGFHSEAAG